MAEDANKETRYSDDDEAHAELNPCRCSFAVTGEQKTYQSIFICRTCCADKQELFCVCEACANHCHKFHDELDYLGMGMAYCDCSRLGEKGCKIQKVSKEDALELHIPVGSIVTLPAPKSSPDGQEYTMDAYSIPELQRDTTICQRMVSQALELIKHSRETFWLDDSQDRSEWSDLEKMSWRIFEHDRECYGIEMSNVGGAEWWVQVKNSLDSEAEEKESEPYNTEISSHTGKTLDIMTPGSEAVDLHYDKDETLAEKYGMGSFPTLSTVTYLTSISNPTVIFTHTYEDEDDAVIPEMLVSHPKQGKHLVFDGRLLHGAPAHGDLRRPYQGKEEDFQKRGRAQLRVTLLVNIWANRKPAGVHPLLHTVRNAVRKEARTVELSFMTEFSKQQIESIELGEEETGTEEGRQRIELPFVCKGITWESEDDESGGLVVVTFPPPVHQNDTIRVHFGPGLQAYLDHSSSDYPVDDPAAAFGSTGFVYEDAYI